MPRASAAVLTDPAALMKRLNDLLHDDLRGGGGRFTTLAIALLEPSGEVHFVPAGRWPRRLAPRSLGRSCHFRRRRLPLAIDARTTGEP